jgi:hypothetical protein
MTELASSIERKVQLKLQLQASDGLKELVSEVITPEHRREFAQRILYMILHTQYPVAMNVDPIHATNIDNEMQRTVREYTSNIEAGGRMYNRSLHVAPELGTYEFAHEEEGMNLRFKLALPDIEANKLLAPPFDQVSSSRAYVVSHLPNHLLLPTEDRSISIRRMRRRLGVAAHQGSQGTVAPDVYYLSHPTIKKWAIADM